MASVLGGIASAATGFGLNKLFGSRKKSNVGQIDPSVGAFNSGGFAGRFGNIGITPERRALTDQLAGQFRDQGDFLGGLRRNVRPGFSQLRENLLNRSRLGGQQAIGNLRDNLRRRGVLGSSFGGDALARVEAENTLRDQEIEAETFLQELQLSEQLANKEFDARRGEFLAKLNDLDAAAKIGQGLMQQATQIFSQNAQLKAELAAKNAGGFGQFFGQNVIDPLQRAVGDLFRGPSSTTTRSSAGTAFLDPITTTTTQPSRAGNFFGNIFGR
jgi:hypothetical protein